MVLTPLHRIDGIAKFYEAVDHLDADTPYSYILQEYIPGKTLTQMLKSSHRFTLIKSFQRISLANIAQKNTSHRMSSKGRRWDDSFASIIKIPLWSLTYS